MLYTLTEEQSTKFYNDLKDAIDLVDRLNAEAVSIFQGWYDDYKSNHSSFFGFKPANMLNFSRKISFGKGIVINDNGVLEGVDDWPALTRNKKLAKIIKREYLDVVEEASIVSASVCAQRYAYCEYNVWKKVIAKMETFMKVPYTIDDEWMKILDDLPKDIKLYKMALKEE